MKIKGAAHVMRFRKTHKILNLISVPNNTTK